MESLYGGSRTLIHHSYVQFSTNGRCEGECQTEATSAVIPAGNITSVRLWLVPLAADQLCIKGVLITAFGGLRQQFLAVEDDGSRIKFEQAKRTLCKKSGLKAYKKIYDFQDLGKTTPVTVVDPMPLMRVKSTSLAHGAMMLFEGEKTSIKIVMQNIGSVPVNMIMPSFSETAAASTNQPKNPKLLREEQYEIDSYADRYQLFSWDKDSTSKTEVMAGSEVEISIEVYGKRGCAGGTITIDYGYNPSEGDHVYTRQVSIPVMVTVKKALDIVEVDILRQQSKCLFIVDVRNTWSSAINVEFHYESKEEDTVQPGATKRYFYV